MGTRRHFIPQIIALLLVVPFVGGAGVCGNVLYDISQRALILDPVARLEFDSDSGSVEVYAFDRTAIALSYYLTGAESDIDDVGYMLDGDVVRAFVRCADGGYCNANYGAEVPLGTAITLAARNGGVKLTGVDAEVSAVIASGGFEAVDLRSPTVEVEVDAGDVTIEMSSPPETVHITVEVGTVDLSLPAGTYRCELAAADGEVETDGIECDPGAASIVAILVTHGDIRARGVS